MSLSQALKLANVELAGLSGKAKLQRFGQIVRLFASEVVGTVQLAPFALKASQLYSKLPAPTNASSSSNEVCLVKSIYYGSKPRNTVDLYLPPTAQQQHIAAGLPVVLFVHGGVWAAGESWHYAPLAASLARLGVITCVMQYTLYPDALVPQLVQEVAAAFDWALDNVGSYGGDRNKVSLVGHSAGAQLCMMALLQRAQAAHTAANNSTNGQQTVAASQQQQQQTQTHLQMPQQFVGVTGVYDIAKHYAYEKDRGVHSLSTMLPAMGGFEQFAANSPSVILAAALQQQLQQQQHTNGQHNPLQQQQQQQQQQVASNGAAAAGVMQQGQELPACGYYDSFSLSGESIAHRIGFDRGSDHYLSSEAGLNLLSLSGMAAVPDFPLEAAAYLPPTVLMSSCTDLTVPWYESAELYWRLFDCGVPVKHLVYNKVGHGEFVTEWPSSFTQPEADGSTNSSSTSTNSSSSSTNSSSTSTSTGSGLQQQSPWLQELPSYCRDLAVVAMGQPPVNFVHKSRVAGSGSSSGTVSSSSTGLQGAANADSGQVPGSGDGAVAGVSSLVPAAPSEWN